MDKLADLIDILRGEDELGVVVRSHIMVEQYLNSLIASFLRRPEYLIKMKLEYSATVKLAIALGLHSRFEPTLNALGAIRNDFSHNLRPSITDQDVNNLYKTLDSENKILLQASLKNVITKSGQSKRLEYAKLVAKEKFMLIVIVVCGGLHTVCNLREARSA